MKDLIEIPTTITKVIILADKQREAYLYRQEVLLANKHRVNLRVYHTAVRYDEMPNALRGIPGYSTMMIIVLCKVLSPSVDARLQMLHSNGATLA